MWLTGVAQGNRDSVHAIASRLPWVLTLIAVITLVLIFLLTGSVILPVKAILMNTLSLTAAFGALVWVFQEGHLGGLGTAATGTLASPISSAMALRPFRTRPRNRVPRRTEAPLLSRKASAGSTNTR